LQQDAYFRSARAFGILANITVGAAMLVMLFTACCEFKPVIIKAMSVSLIFGAIFMLFTYLLFGSTICDFFGQCDFSVGGVLTIFAFLTALIAAFFTYQVGPARVDLGDRVAVATLSTPQAPAHVPGTTTTTETQMPDGTRRIVKTTVNPDGSQQVEETVITQN
jgi:hypothetical protein